VSGTVRPLLGFLAAWVWLVLVLNLPNWTGNLLGPDHLRPSAEVAALFGLLALASALGWRMGRGLRGVLAGIILMVMALRLADFASNMLIGRPVNLSLDLVLLPAILEVLTGSATVLELAVAAVLVPALLAGLFVLNRAALDAAARFLASRPHRHLFAGALAALVAPALAGVPVFAPVNRGVLSLVTGQASLIVQASDVRAEYLNLFERDDFAHLPDGAVLSNLAGRDVYVMFFESYGETVLTDPRYRPVVAPTLASFERALTEHGFGVRSATVESPIQGGQSWLAHGTFLSGVKLADQALYDLMLTSQRRSLVRYFSQAGYRTLAVMPALIRPWPEGSFWGFDQIYRTQDLNYKGPSFGWAAIPDQYTLDFIRRQEKAQEKSPRDRPLFIEYALISSHGPWEPLPPLLPDWETLGDGSAYHGLEPERSAEQPLWSDITRKYIDSIDYTLKVLRDYITRYVPDDALIIVVGDHQPAPLITGDFATRSVPMHVISRDPDLLAPFERWGFTDGMVPRPGPATLRMEEFRDRFLGAFSRFEAG
jgi:hypothetical protein